MPLISSGSSHFNPLLYGPGKRLNESDQSPGTGSQSHAEFSGACLEVHFLTPTPQKNPNKQRKNTQPISGRKSVGCVVQDSTAGIHFRSASHSSIDMFNGDDSRLSFFISEV